MSTGVPSGQRQMVAATRCCTAAGLLGLIALAGLTGCGAARGTAEARTYAVQPTPEGRRVVTQLVSREFSGARAILDEDAVTDDGVRILDPSQLRRSTRLAIAGGDPIDTGRTERFHLVNTGGRCVLIHDRTDRGYELSGSVCAPR